MNFKRFKTLNFQKKRIIRVNLIASISILDTGVYRKSNHWGRVANCRWKLNSNGNYKNQENVIGFAKWTNFYPLNESEKSFYIEVDFDSKICKIQPKKEQYSNHLFTYSEAQKRLKNIYHLFKENKWANYFDTEINELRYKIFTAYIQSDKTLQQIKTEQQ